MPTFDSNSMIYKIVYYGPGLSGKTSNFEFIYQKTPSEYRSELICYHDKDKRILYFEYFPPTLGKVQNKNVKLRLFTIPGGLFQDSACKNMLRQVDGIIFVVDSQRKRVSENFKSFEELKNNLVRNVSRKMVSLR